MEGTGEEDCAGVTEIFYLHFGFLTDVGALQKRF